jgi:predicted nuclease of predicted toxin-antitoxin system
MWAKSGCPRLPTRKFLTFALGTAAIVVTLDADFHAILAVSGAMGPSVIRIRIQGLRARRVVECVQFVLSRFETELESGAMVTVKARKSTCHRLPIGGTR